MSTEKRIRCRAGGTANLLMFVALCGLTPALFGQSADPEAQKSKSWAKQVDIDVMELPPQVLPPAPGDTDWLHYNRMLDGNRYSELDAITTANVGQLEEVCRVRLAGPGPFSAGTILANGMLYTTSARATIAIEPTNCDIVWKSIYTPEQNEIYNANRGVAHWQGRIFRGTGDGRVVAYDAMTGHELWRVKASDPTNGEYLDAAPLAWEGMVVIGIAAGDLGIAGRMMAFDATSGKQLWSFNTIPRPGEFGNETWPGETWKNGGGGTWSAYTLDTQTGELFVPVANPAPAFDPQIRRGDNLFTNSVLVLDARTGKYRWHYQTRPNDNHDYGVSPPAMLLELDGRKLVVQASKDGFVYLIDRARQQLLWKTPVTTILNHDADATPEGIRVCPGAKGGVEYNSPGYDPVSGLLITGSVDWCYHLTKTAYPPHAPGNPYLGGQMNRGDPVGTGWIVAIDARSGKVRWRYKTPAPVIGAITPTAGGITFAGDTSGLLYAFRTADGQLLRMIQTGGAIAGGIITYRLRGEQYVAVGSGNISRSSWTGATGIPSMILYRLPVAGGGAGDPAALTPDLARGRAVYGISCASCHGAAGQGGEAPPLLGVSARYTQQQAVAFLIDPRPPMPKLYPGTLSAQDLADVAAFVRTLPAP